MRRVEKRIGLPAEALLRALVLVAICGAVQAEASQHARWPHSTLRPTIDLDGTWQFRTDPEGVGEEQAWFLPSVPFEDRIQVPGSWDAQGFGDETDKVYHNYVGKAWYRRTVWIPTSWRGKHVFLRVGGVHRYADVWVDGRHVRRHVGYVSPFEVDLTDLVRPGKRTTIAIRVDSEQDWEIDALTGAFDLIDYMFVSWGGIWHHVWLEARDVAHVDDVFIMPRVSQGAAEVEVTVRTLAPQVERTLRVEVIAPDGRAAAMVARDLVVSQGTRIERIQVPVRNPALWSPNHPHLYRLRAVLLDRGNAVDDLVDRFGMREIEVRGPDIYINGNKTFLHGYGDDTIYPRTLIPPATHDEHRRRLSLAKAYGFNYVRHHSTVPVPEYFDVADEVGILVQPELPIAYEPYFQRGNQFDAARMLYRETWEAIIRRYRNHPSAFGWCMGNELYQGLAIGEELYDLAKALDPTRPVYDSDGVSLAGDRRTLDLLPVQFDVASLPFGYHRTKHDMAPPPTKPIISHEMGNYVTYPDISQAELFVDTVKPFWLVQAAQELEKRGLLDQAEVFARRSAELQAVCHKVEVENLRRSPYTDGHSLWLFQDYWTNSTGIVDHHYRLKGRGPEFYRRFIADVVLLADLDRRTFASGERLTVPLHVSDYGEDEIENAELEWQLASARARLAKGRLGPINVREKGLTSIGEIKLALPAVATATKMKLSVQLTGESYAYANDWDLWVYPRSRKLGVADGVRVGRLGLESLAEWYPDIKPTEASPDPAVWDVVIARRPTRALLEYARAGGRAIALSPGALLPTEPATFEPAWWMGEPGGDASAGTVIADGPALAEFPHDGFCDLQFYRLIHNRPVMLLDGVPGGDRPLVRALDVYMGSRNKAYLAEWRLGNGGLLVSCFDLSPSTLREAPEARWMLRTLARYVAGGRFAPSAELPLGLAVMQTEGSGVPERSLPVEGYSALRSLAGETVSHRSYRDQNTDTYVVRGVDGTRYVEWETGEVPGEHAEESVTFVWAGGLGWITEPEATFALSLAGTPLLDFGVTQQTREWYSQDGRSRLFYDVRMTFGPDSLGVFYLTVPSQLVKVGTNVLRVVGSASGSRRWFVLQPYRDVLRDEEG